MIWKVPTIAYKKEFVSQFVQFCHRFHGFVNRTCWLHFSWLYYSNGPSSWHNTRPWSFSDLCYAHAKNSGHNLFRVCLRPASLLTAVVHFQPLNKLFLGRVVVNPLLRIDAKTQRDCGQTAPKTAQNPLSVVVDQSLCEQTRQPSRIEPLHTQMFSQNMAYTFFWFLHDVS